MYILFDVGGTKTRVAFSVDGVSVCNPHIFDNHLSFDEGMDLLTQEIIKFSGGENIQAISGGLPGPLDKEKSTLIASPHLPLWVGKNIKRKLEEAFEVPVYLENDAALVGLGEASRGAGKKYKNIAYVTVSTGVGGVKIKNRRIEDGSFEPGHQIIDADKTGIPGADSGSLEDYISGAAVKKQTGKNPWEIKDKEFWEKMARYLAVGVHNIILYWQPDAVIIGGSMMKEVGIPIDVVEKETKRIMKILPTIPPIVKAELGDFGGLYGALEYLNRK